jgi:hypothetical protein
MQEDTNCSPGEKARRICTFIKKMVIECLRVKSIGKIDSGVYGKRGCI